MEECEGQICIWVFYALVQFLAQIGGLCLIFGCTQDAIHASFMKQNWHRKCEVVNRRTEACYELWALIFFCSTEEAEESCNTKVEEAKAACP